jgi:hypothetical protein
LRGNGPHDVVVHVERDDLDLVGRNCHGPDDAVLVVVLLDDGRQRAGDADAVAAHLEGLLDAVLVGEGGAHGLGVLGAQLEDLAHLDATRSLERARRTWGRGRPPWR